MTNRTPVLVALLAVVVSVGMVACTPREGAESDGEDAATQPPSADRHCFRGESPFEEDSERVDVIELSVTLEGARATGVYSWRPAFKDQRVGTLEGDARGDMITARYGFSQEGVHQSVEITIALEDARAVVRGGPPSLGLESAIPRVDCPR